MRFEIEIRGVVQGVGFRPFIHNLATSMQLYGSVSNSDYGVYIVVDSSQTNVDEFIKQIRARKPRLSEIESIKVSPIKAEKIYADFSIKKSKYSSETS